MKVILIILFSIIVIFCVIYLSQCGHGGAYYVEDGRYKYVESSQSFAHIMKHPAFKGFGYNMIPWENGIVPAVTKPLSLKYLLPKLGAWDPDTVASGINYLIDKINAGNNIYYSYYTEKDKKEDPYKDKTGLIFLKGKENEPFAIVCPGGGFTSVASIQEGFPVAQRLNEKGYNVFVLKYRVGAYKTDSESKDKIVRAEEDLGAAIGYIFKNADTFKISKENYSTWGFSAGGRMVGNYSYVKDLGYQHFNLPAPIASVMGYPVMPSSFDERNVSAYVTICSDDKLVPVKNVDERVKEMQAAGIEVEYHRFAKGGHGFGVGVGTDAEGWMNSAIDFGEKHIHL